MSDDRQYELGAITWHSSEEEGPPDVGITLGLGDGAMLWLGEMPDATIRDHGYEPGWAWWIVLYGRDSTSVLGTIVNPVGAQKAVEMLSAILTKAPAKDEENGNG